MKRWLLLSVAISLCAFAISSWIYCFRFDTLPPRLPIHWDINGRPNGWVARDQIFWTLFLMPAAMLLIVLLTVVLPWLSPRPFDLDRFRSTYAYVMMLIVLLLGYMHIVILFGSINENAIDVGRWLIGGIMVVLGLMGNVLGRVRRNFYLGVRTPWTLASERVWIETHRRAAWVMVAAAILGLVALIARVPPSIIFVAYLGAVAAVPLGYSWWLYRRLDRQGKLSADSGADPLGHNNAV
jgi:uncharacterized membrane protein